MSEKLERARDVASTIADDCATDAAELDRTPFTPRGMGEALGSMLALIAGLAHVVMALADEVAEIRDR